MDNTANLQLPYIMPAQAQKHVTHNEALAILDALVQLSVASRALGEPPGAPSDGERHIVGEGTGPWAGWDGSVAFHLDGAWIRLTPRPGWRAWVADEELLCLFDGTAWAPLTGGSEDVPTLGVGGQSADATNRLALASPASLFNHAGDDHRLKVNKNLAADTAAVLLQTGHSGRAEIGTTGSDDLHLKVSPDGASWREALRIGVGDGKVSLGRSFMNFSALNIKGRALSSGADSWFGITVTQTDADNTSKGGAVLSGAPFANAHKPFMVLGPWATGSAHQVYYGGGGWGCPDATRHTFYTGAYQPGVDNSATIALDITAASIGAARPLLPLSDNSHALGGPLNRWSVVHAATGTISTSDARLKQDVAPVPLGLAFVRDLEPVSYRWIVGGHDIGHEREVDPAPKGEKASEITVERRVPRPGLRTHYGLLAQQVKDALEAHGICDFAGWTLADKDDPDSEQGLRYDQFVPILIQAVQDLAREMEALRSRGQEARAATSSPLAE